MSAVGAHHVRPSRDCNSLHVHAGANVRSRLLWLPYGDQALALRAATYRAVGGFRAYSMMVSGTPSCPLALTPTHTNTHTHRNRHFFLASLSICPSLLLTLARSPHPRSDTHLHRRQEDFEFVCRIRARALASGGRVRILRQTARCSSRRWDKKGVYKNTFLNWGFVFLYWIGVGPDTIFRLYYGR